ncbi:CueP family metal-binding protein [Microbacterium halotolerans]|uniref:CueP family metal-binding protein n=1 Tax=Microbacterium halotolerans TaxID=246613 RepID=UPI000E6ABF3B|nr:CueP family metal-binding protein [Microbacterium halotolerans]
MNHDIFSRRRAFALPAAVLAVAALALSGCAAASDAEPATTDGKTSDSVLLTDHDLDGLDAAQVIERLDTMPVAERPAGLIASVLPDELVLTDDQDREVRMPMPEDEVYVAVAPYREQTHECHFHSLTTCLGELRDADLLVTLTDESGDVLVDETRSSYDNGFVGFWVPRGVEATVTVTYEGSTGSATISTSEPDDATCITGLQLT